MKKHILIIMVIALLFIEIRNDVEIYNKVFPPRFSLPLKDPVYTSYFGERRDPFRKRNIGGGGGFRRFHNGIDMTAPKGSFVYSVDEGVVVVSRWKYRGYGTAIKIRHNDGTVTLYGHLSEKLVKRGDRVKRGDIIGIIGSTGISTGRHLHFTVIDSTGKSVDPIGYFTNTIRSY